MRTMMTLEILLRLEINKKKLIKPRINLKKWKTRIKACISQSNLPSTTLNT